MFLSVTFSSSAHACSLFGDNQIVLAENKELFEKIKALLGLFLLPLAMCSLIAFNEKSIAGIWAVLILIFRLQVLNTGIDVRDGDCGYSDLNLVYWYIAITLLIAVNISYGLWKSRFNASINQ